MMNMIFRKMMIIKSIKNMIQVKKLFKRENEVKIDQSKKIVKNTKIITMMKFSRKNMIPNRICTEKI